MSAGLQLADYLERLPGTTFRKLYQQPSTAFAIFRRMLPHLAKTIVMALLYTPKPMLLEDLDLWVKPESKRTKDHSLSVLRGLHIISITVPGKGKRQEMQLTTNFKASFQRALSGGGTHESFGVPSNLPAPPEVDGPFLERYARRKWDDILHFVVNSVGNRTGEDRESSSGPMQSVKELLLAGRLVERRGGNATGIGITQAGFTFLLQEANAQVWTLLLLWLEATDRPGTGQSVDMLSFLFVLASLELGRAYDTNALTEERRNMLPFLVDIGLIFIPAHKPQQYFPTRLSTTLTSSSSALRSVSEGFAAVAADSAPESTGAVAPAQQRGSIIMETNYRIYAYTSNPLQIAVLALFANLKMRFHEMVSGRLSRESIRRAVSYGITSDQIINYLATHAHDQMRRRALTSGKPVLPPTVVDQIRLWQLENERMKTTSGFLFKDFDDAKEYEACAGYASEIGVCVWRNDRRAMFFASKHEQIRDFLKLRKKAD
ncbi:related to transcription/repair factor TFIIH subunit [Cephalotrichum gorgonifer]|uniref:RNA polymerase II transcription factor B subunit 2 n=1 Tax=Cephalotrichum gorgonifer TaxID=2041049 RepID=A0AAE8N8F7_9PEZI|nr:related to transcription/repair factor TFIIH subunit [Cephalotrichum gorgonifer]